MGQEKDSTLLTCWISKNESNQDISIIGCYNAKEKSFEILRKFSKRENLIQASINISKSLLLYVIKEQIQTDNCETEDEAAKFVYRAFLAELKTDDEPKELLETARSTQVLAQFLWYKQQRNSQDRFLLMIHQECIFFYTLVLKRNPNGTEANWCYDKTSMKIETIVKNFVWSQWDSKIQSLFYIHLKQSTRISLEKEEDDKIISPTLSAFQFHDDLPTETVLNIPLNLPKMPTSSKCSEYEDDTIPLRIHDSSLNLIIVTDDEFGIFICHYYLYQPIKQQDEENQSNSDVHFAYSVTMVHSSLVVHCIIPGIPFEKAKLMKPTFTLIDEYILVFQADLFVNMLDIGLEHEPCGHIVAEPFTRQSSVTHLVPCFNSISFDNATLDLISLQIPKNHLIETFKNDTSIDNRINILHYFLVHHNDFDIFAELLNIIMEQPLNLDTVGLLKEALVAGTYSALRKGLAQDALSLLKLLPLTTANTTKPIQAKVFDLTVGLSHEFLHNTPMMLLSPQQRLSPYRQDIWTRLHDRLHDNKDCKKRFNCDQVTEKLMYSLACYQPEALSRCTTPQTPSSGQMMMSELSAINSFSSSKRTQNDMLPFIEFETCTASKQEHVISVNLRELSMHLVKHSVKQITGFRWLKDFEPTAPSFVHAVSTKYVTAQLEISRLLCVFVCRAAGIDARIETERGFNLIDKLSMPRRYLLFLMLERYVLAIESMSFPLPQGFSSFFTYLGFRSLEFDQFIEYSQRHVFELQIDVMKIIMNGKKFLCLSNTILINFNLDIKDTDEGISRKLSLLSLLPRTRARRLLNNWNHPISLRIRSMQHVENVLSGNSAGRSMSLSSSRNSNSLGDDDKRL